MERIGGNQALFSTLRTWGNCSIGRKHKYMLQRARSFVKPDRLASSQYFVVSPSLFAFPRAELFVSGIEHCNNISGNRNGTNCPMADVSLVP